LHFCLFLNKLELSIEGNSDLNHSLPKNTGAQPVGKMRFIVGGAVFTGGFLSPLLIPLVTSSDLPVNWKAILSTGLVAGLPEVGMLLAVAILGKQGFAQLKEMFFSRFRKITEPSAVSLTRYRIGLFMFFTPLLLGWLQPYVAYFYSPAAGGAMLPVILFDLMFASSFIVLGAEFWQKIQSLFVHSSSAEPTGTPPSTDSSQGESR
jgi:hypothetical protein